MKLHRGVKTTVYNSYVVGVRDAAIFLFLKNCYFFIFKNSFLRNVINLKTNQIMIPFHAEVEACVSI